jgi:3-hydroxyisobutyrate dehydrogenase-like beta-hydroxyacid dehydrogenase
MRISSERVSTPRLDANDTIGIIGFGAIGTRIATRLMSAGYYVCGTNRTATKAEPLIDRGMVWMNTPREVAAAADVTFSMVTDDNALKDISEGSDGILAALRPGKLYVDTSTVSPEASFELSGRVRELGAAMLDAPVSGSVPPAEAGTLVIMVGATSRRSRWPLKPPLPPIDAIGAGLTRPVPRA